MLGIIILSGMVSTILSFLFTPPLEVIGLLGLSSLVFCFSFGAKARSFNLLLFSFLISQVGQDSFWFYHLSWMGIFGLFSILGPRFFPIILSKILKTLLPEEIKIGFFGPKYRFIAGDDFIKEEFASDPEVVSPANRGGWLKTERVNSGYWSFWGRKLPGEKITFIVARDKTQNWRSEKLLWDLEDMVFFLEPSGKILASNFSGEKFLGVERSLQGGNIFSFLFPEVNQKFSRCFSRVKKGKGVSRCFLEQENQEQGKTFWQWEFEVIPERGKTPGEILVRARDITRLVENQKKLKNKVRQLRELNLAFRQEIKERKKTEEMLAAENEKLDITLQSIGEGVITTDEKMAVTGVNPAAAEIAGWNQEEVVGQSLEKIYQVTERKTTGNSSGENSLLSTRQGGMKVISETRSPIKNRKGKVLGQVIIFRDITKKKHIEEQVIVSQKMESIGQLAAGIAHEINTPMQYIGDNLSFLQKAFATLDQYIDIPQGRARHLKEEIPNALQDAKEGAQRVNKLVLSMKNFAHPGDSEMRLGDINQGIESTLEIAKNEWKYAAEVELDLDPTLPGIGCIMEKINQVFLNMVVNSAQAISEAREKGLIERGKIKIKTCAHAEYIQIRIADNGVGIPPELKNKIFDPFFTTKEVGKGTGQGLTIAHDIIVNKHNGELFVESEPGMGTEFIINLPLTNPVAG